MLPPRSAAVVYVCHWGDVKDLIQLPSSRPANLGLIQLLEHDICEISTSILY
jgi:hypothetical protein